MPNVSSFNINDVALYYHALRCVADEPLDTVIAAERVRERLVGYLERRRASLSLPPLRTEMPTLGAKALTELKQMKLVAVEDGKVRLLTAGVAIVDKLTTGEGRQARRMVLSRMLDTFDNMYGFVKKLSPPTGRELVLPVPRGSNVAVDTLDDSNVDLRGETGLDLTHVCTAWSDWCEENARTDLIPINFVAHAQALFEGSRGKEVGNRIKNAVQRLVLERATDGIVQKMPIYRTLRDRLSTAGALNSRIRVVDHSPLALEVVYSCIRFGPPETDTTDWVMLEVPRTGQPILIHEPEPKQIADQLYMALRESAETLTARAGYYRIYELRDRACDVLRISQGVFDAAFIHIYQEKQGAISLGVDYETITAKRLPIEIRAHGRSEYFNLVAFRQPVQVMHYADHSQASGSAVR